MKHFIFSVNFLIKFLIFFILSILIFFSFRIDIIYNNNFSILFSFLLIQLIISSIIFKIKKGLFSIISYNLFFIILLNLITTPFFHLMTFDIPARNPNHEVTKEYKSDFFKGMFSGKHYISVDEKGYRTNKKIDYNNKEKNTLRIFTVGASTTEQGSTDNNKTWSNLLGVKLSEFTNKNIEVINIGMAGLRAEHHFFSLKRIKKYSPDIIIFLTGINDWNRHIVNNEKKYLFPNYEIKYDFKKSILFNTFQNINKQIRRKFFN